METADRIKGVNMLGFGNEIAWPGAERIRIMRRKP